MKQGKIKMRILIDTNILISGLFFHGLPKELLSNMDFEKFFNNLQSFEQVSDLKVSRDPKDDKVINCAIDAKAIYIVSGDNDLLELKNFAGIEIVTAREFYDRYIKTSAM